VTTDGSLTGLGDFLNGRPAQGVWEGRHLLNINCLEMKSVFLSPRYFLLDLRVYNMLVWTDNMSVVSYINHQGGLHSHPGSDWCSRSREQSQFQGIQIWEQSSGRGRGCTPR